jgi:hypothetical protein
MDIASLSAGATLWLEDGSLVVVVAPSVDGASVRVRYLDCPFSPERVGTEASCTDYEVVGYADGERADSRLPPAR